MIFGDMASDPTKKSNFAYPVLKKSLYNSIII